MGAMISGGVKTVKEFAEVPARGFLTRSNVPRQEGFFRKWHAWSWNASAG